MSNRRMQPQSVFDAALLKGALLDSLKKLDLRTLWRNPVMFCVEIASGITRVTFVMSLTGANKEPIWFTGAVTAWLWLTVLFSTFAEALAEGRGKARAASLRKSRTHVTAKRMEKAELDGTFTTVGASTLRKGDLILVDAGEMIAGDGDVVTGAALINESAVTGESAPVIRESGGDRSAVTCGTTVISSRIVVRITANPGETFLDRMIGLIEGAKWRKTPNEVVLYDVDLHRHLRRHLSRADHRHRPGSFSEAGQRQLHN